MQKPCVFLSYSSRDRAFVRRLNLDLKSHSIDTWMDEDNIPFGASIPEEIQKGLNKATILLVFLSEHSVASRWVANEWQTKFFQQVQDRKIIVVPILINDCEIPPFLSDKKYVDFRRKEEYESNFSLLLHFLARLPHDRSEESPTPPFNKKSTILDYTKEIIEDLRFENISMPVHKHLPIVETLRKIPRSGKRVRLNKFAPKVKIRTVYDHILSLAHLADCVLPHIDHGINKSEFGDIALCVAYHELNEVVLGDIPSYTSLTNQKRKLIRIYAEERLRSVEPLRRERIANELIWMFLSEKHRKALEAMMNILDDRNSKVKVIFRALDKIDPIVAVWRYIHVYRGRLGDTPKDFIHRMKDFFENPDVKAYIRANKIDSRLADLVINLQDRGRAWDYYEDPSRVFGDDDLFKMPKTAIRAAIEATPLFHDAGAAADAAAPNAQRSRRRKELGERSRPRQ
jgi:5'-deoxynucleotidase YfbR-like HD superfamily hydrolase